MAIRYHNVVDGVHIPGDHDGVSIGDPGSSGGSTFPDASGLEMGDVLYWDAGTSTWRLAEGDKELGYALALDVNGRVRWTEVGAVVDPNPPPPPAGDVTAPAVPTGLNVAIGDRQALLDWDNNAESDLASYKVYWALDTAGPYVLLATRTVSNYTATGLTNGTTYWFKVSAVDTSSNESAQSSSVSVVPAIPPADTTAPATPTGLTAVAGDRQVVLDWANNTETDRAGYHVYRSTTSTGPWTRLSSPTGSAYTSIGLVNGTTYFFAVSAFDTSGNESAKTTAVEATPIAPAADTTPPPVPSGLTATPGNTQVILDWANSSASDFKHFVVYRSLTSGGTYVQVGLRTLSDFTNTGLSNGTEYFYKVSAVDQDENESAKSLIVSATPIATPAPPPTPGLPTPNVTFDSGNPYTTTKVNNEVAGTVFRFTTTGGDSGGAVYKTTVPTKNGNKYRFDAGTSLDGEMTRELAFANGPSNVHLYDCEWTGYIGQDAKGVADNTGASAIRAGAGWRVYRPYGHENKWSAFGFQGANIYMEDGRLSYNGQMGFGNGSTDCEINGTEVDYNGTHIYPGQSNLVGNSGGCKIAVATRFTFRNIHSHHNYAAGSTENATQGGHGLWADINNVGIKYIDCNLHDNEGAGIFHEVSLDFEISGCTIKNNAKNIVPDIIYPHGAQIKISASGGDLGWIHHNTIEITQGTLGYAGIGMVNQPSHPHWTSGQITKGCLGVRNILIENNEFVISGSQWEEIMAITGALPTVRSADQWCGQYEAWDPRSNIRIRDNSFTISGGQFPSTPYVRNTTRLSTSQWNSYGYGGTTPPAVSGITLTGAPSTWAGIISGKPANTTFIVPTGTHTHTASATTPMIPLRTGDTLFFQSGAICDGNNSAQYLLPVNTINNIRVWGPGGVVRKFNSPTQYAAITARTFEGASAGFNWTIEDLWITDNRYGGIHLSQGSVMRNLRVTNNDVIGIKVYWVTSTALIDNCETSWNNRDAVSGVGSGTFGDPFWEAGGSKFAWTNGLVVRNSISFQNDGPGWWTDIDNRNYILEDCVSDDDSGIGIFHEISFSGIIRRNTVRRCGWRNRGGYWEAGICIAASGGTETRVEDNVVEDCYNGIILLQQNRGSSAAGLGEYLVQNVLVQRNDVRGETGQNNFTGAIQEVGSNAIFTTRNNDFEDNDYTGPHDWRWDDGTKTFAQWQAYGHDDTGSYVP